MVEEIIDLTEWQEKTKPIDQETQLRALMTVSDTFNSYHTLSDHYRNRMVRVYDEVSTFRERKRQPWTTDFKVNKAFAIENNTVSKIVAKNPKWIVSQRLEEFISPEDEPTDDINVRIERMKKMQMAVKAMQDYLTYIFDNYGYNEKLRLWVKNMVRYGNSYAKVDFKYKVARIKNKDWVVERVVWEAPDIVAKSWTDIYVDPRYVLLEDMPAIIEDELNIRLDDLKRNPEYFNIDMLEALPNQKSYESDKDKYKQTVLNIAWIPTNIGITVEDFIDKNRFRLKVFYGYFQEKEDWEEKLYKITTVNSLFVIWFKEISQIPFEDIKCFEDTETHYAVWFIEPMVGLQREMNFKKNSAATYINKSLYRGWFYNPASKVNPRDLYDKPNNIIPTWSDRQTLENNLWEIPHREINPSYFQEQNDMERQIQDVSHSVNVSTPKSQQALTNTATWIRVEFFESNVVIDEVRKHYEEWLVRLAYKLLQETAENMTSNIVIKKIDDEWYWELNKELFRDALNRYSIKVEAWSSSFDSIEKRRSEAIAKWNIMQWAAQAWLNVDLKEWFKDVMNTFEVPDVERFLKPELPQLWAEILGWQELEQPEVIESSAAELTEQVAQWWLTELQ